MLCLIPTLILSPMVLALAAQPINVFSIKSEQKSEQVWKRSHSILPAMSNPRPWPEPEPGIQTPNMPYLRQAATQSAPKIPQPGPWAEQASPKPQHTPNMAIPRPWAKQVAPHSAVPLPREKRAEGVSSPLAQSPGIPNIPYPSPLVENSESIAPSTLAHSSTTPNMAIPRPWVKNSGSVAPRSLARSSITPNMPYPRAWIKKSESFASRALAQDLSGSTPPARSSRMNGAPSSDVDRHHPERAAVQLKKANLIFNPRPSVEGSEMKAEK